VRSARLRGQLRSPRARAHRSRGQRSPRLPDRRAGSARLTCAAARRRQPRSNCGGATGLSCWRAHCTPQPVDRDDVDAELRDHEAGAARLEIRVMPVARGGASCRSGARNRRRAHARSGWCFPSRAGRRAGSPSRRGRCLRRRWDDPLARVRRRSHGYWTRPVPACWTKPGRYPRPSENRNAASRASSLSGRSAETRSCSQVFGIVTTVSPRALRAGLPK